ncbi:hypothetical protein FHT77_004865 [Rhizobium sp. BK181]|uniref:hypothetical protein n=1 Tax=Rhizobium sp. BK181 TaxID=2587072 RepID=UPI0016084A16|nr:hypothetical protein [Rhizobium sp. BK181]MBB3318956.1 hypothetical protein [Rhizobium sp. BK181]
MGKRNEIAVAEKPAPIALADRLDFEKAPASVVLPALSFELQRLAASMRDVADVSLEMDMTSEGVSLKFRAYSRRLPLM